MGGFSTVEMLVAFVILSLGLGLAVQNVSQASLNLRQARAQDEETLLLRRTISEELPRLLRKFDGSPLSLDGDGWALAVEPLNAGSVRSPLRVVARIGRRAGHQEAIYLTVVAPPTPGAQG